jgi:nucleotide-binding universal stress UspA family protein
MYDRILVPTDGSDRAKEAARHAIAIAERFGARIDVVYVISPKEIRHEAPRWLNDPSPINDYSTAREVLESKGEEFIQEIEDLAAEAGIECRGEILGGKTGEEPNTAILDYLDDHDIDLVVMGTHGRTGVTRAVLGSVTERVLRLSDVPMVAVPERSTPQD